MSRVLIFLFFIFFTSNLFCQVLNYDQSGKKINSNEKITLIITKQKVTNNSISNQESAVAAIAAILPTVIDQGLKLYKNILSNKEAKFVGEYKSRTSESGFWENPSQMNLPELTLKRELAKNGLLASEFFLIPEQSSDGTAFRYRLSRINLKYSKAKITSKSNELNIKIDIKFTAIEKSDNKFTKVEKGTNSIELNAVKFGSQSLNEDYYSGWFPIIPNSGSDLRNGNYEIEVAVTEINPANLKPKRVKEFLENNSEAINSISKVIIENTIKKEDSDSEETKNSNESDENNN